MTPSQKNIRTPVRKVQKEYFIPGPSPPLRILERAGQRCPGVWRTQSFLLLSGHLSHICPHLTLGTFFFFLDSCLGFQCTIYFFCHYNFCLIQCQKGGTKILPFFSQDGKSKAFHFTKLKSRVDTLKSDLRFWANFSAFHLGHSYFTFTTHTSMLLVLKDREEIRLE